jgi:Gas vesicle synthesis protein GvpL/GvpF
MVHLYALTEHPAQLPSVQGLGASHLASAAVGAIDAVFSEIDGAAADPTETAIIAHAHVVEELAKVNAAVLPARLARPYENEASLLDGIRTRGAQLRGALERVRGCVEMGVRVVRKEDGKNEAAPTGADYMRHRLDAVKVADNVADELDAAVKRLSRDSTRGVTGTRELVLTAAYLVPKDEAEAFRAAVDDVASNHPELAYVCVGPWPAYSFALVDGGAHES